VFQRFFGKSLNDDSQENFIIHLTVAIIVEEPLKTTLENVSLFSRQVVLLLTGVQYCSPKCNLFRCSKNAMMYRDNTVWCRWTEDDCDVARCNFATCAKRRLLPRGVCGESVRRKTVETEPEKALIPTVRLKGKALRKLGEKEIF